MKTKILLTTLIATALMLGSLFIYKRTIGYDYSNHSEISIKSEKETSDTITEVEKIDFTIKLSTSMGEFLPIIKKFEQQTQTSGKISGLSFPLFKEDINRINDDLLWVTNNNYLINEILKNKKYLQTNIYLYSPLELWIKNDWANEYNLTNKNEISWDNIIELIKLKKLKYTITNPINSDYSLNILVQTTKNELEQKILLDGISHISGSSNLTPNETLYSNKSTGFFISNALGKLYKKQGIITSEFRRLRIKNSPIHNEITLLIKSNSTNNEHIFNLIEFIKENPELIKPTGYSLLEKSKINNQQAENTYESLLSKLFLNKQPAINTYILFEKGKNKDKIKNAILKFSEFKNAYPWTEYNSESNIIIGSKEKINLDYNKEKHKEILENAIKNYEGFDKEYLYDEIKKIVNEINFNRNKNQIILIVNTHPYIDNQFADFYEDIRKQIENMSYLNKPRIIIITTDKIETNYYHSIAGLTLGKVMVSSNTEKLIERKLIEAKHLY